MSSYVIVQNVAGLYARPETDSEMISQAVLGAVVIAEETQNDFCHVTTEDRYSGWLRRDLLTPLPEPSGTPGTTISTLFADVYSGADAHSELLTKLVAGTNIVLARRAGVGDWVPLLLPDKTIGYVHRVSLHLSHQPDPEMQFQTLRSQFPSYGADFNAALGRMAAKTAMRFIGTPYLWGGCTPFGIDCSGLTQLAYKLNGIQLLRDCHLQFQDRRFVRVEEEQSLEAAILDEGDLVVFSRREDKCPTHIGIALGDGRFLHARGGQGVRIDFCDSPGYGELYIGAIRLSADADFAIQSA